MPFNFELHGVDYYANLLVIIIDYSATLQSFVCVCACVLVGLLFSFVLSRNKIEDSWQFHQCKAKITSLLLFLNFFFSFHFLLQDIFLGTKGKEMG